ncbi:MAG: pseudouridine synthase [Bacillota bacterium]|nr:pseudouridine synthase [Bacillota bacterium]
MQKVLAQAGVASRRAAEELIRAGRVSVNGQIVTELGVKVDPERDEVAVDGRKLRRRAELVYVMLNKPAGVLTTARDPQGRPTVLQLVAGTGVRLFPVGRLDADTEGLLLLTNDGDLAHRLLHPRYHVPKTYVAEVEGAIPAAALARLAEGVSLEDGCTAPAEVRLVRRSRRRSIVELTIREGRKRQVKRMLAAVGHPVRSLRRVAFGPLALDGLPVGAWRPLAPGEVTALRQATAARSHNLPGGGPD